jgi:alpha-glucosidase
MSIAEGKPGVTDVCGQENSRMAHTAEKGRQDKDCSNWQGRPAQYLQYDTDRWLMPYSLLEQILFKGEIKTVSSMADDYKARLTLLPWSENIVKLEFGRPSTMIEELLFPKRAANVNRQGNWRLSETEQGTILSFQSRKIVKFNVTGNGDSLIFAQTIGDEDRVYGLGEKYARLNRRFKTFNMWNTDQFNHLPTGDPAYVSIPFYIVASKGSYTGIFFSYAGFSKFDTGVERKDAITVTINSKEAALYVIHGETPAEIISRYSEITGKPLLPPKWAVGYNQCRYSYKTESEVLDMAATFRHKKIPCDAIWLDIDYMEDYMNFTWDKRKFPNPRAMLDKIHSIGFKLVTILDVGIKVEKGYSGYETLKKADGFLKNGEDRDFLGSVWPGICAFPDFLRTDVRELWGNCIGEWVKQGIDGVWLDMNEPSIFVMIDAARELIEFITRSESLAGYDSLLADSNFIMTLRDKAASLSPNSIFKGIGHMPLGSFHTGDNGEKHSDLELHNAYSTMEVMATAASFKVNNPGKRWFILSRSGYAGIQQYAAVWTGDNQSDWGHLAISIPQLLSLGLSGVPFVGADVGGFSDDADPELLARWTQLGAFYPFFRNHTVKGSARQEPWSFGKKYEKIISDAIKLRYRILPQIYWLLVKSHREGIPVMRPMFYEFPDDSEAYDIDDQFMLGSEILVAPVISPGARARGVYLPLCKWLNMWTGEVAGPGWHFVDAPLNRIPYFLKEDTGIVMAGPVDNTQKEWKLRVEVFLETQACIRVYDDDGESLAESLSYEVKLCFVRRKDNIDVDGEVICDGFGRNGKIEVRVHSMKPVNSVRFLGNTVNTTRTGDAVSFRINIGDLLDRS